MADLPTEKKSPVLSLVAVVGAIAVVIAVLAHAAPPETPAQLAQQVHDQASAAAAAEIAKKEQAERDEELNARFNSTVREIEHRDAVDAEKQHILNRAEAWRELQK